MFDLGNGGLGVYLGKPTSVVMIADVRGVYGSKRVVDVEYLEIEECCWLKKREL